MSDRGATGTWMVPSTGLDRSGAPASARTGVPLQEAMPANGVGRRLAGRSTLIIPFGVACAALADRAQIGVATGGHGTLPLLVVVAPLAAVVTIAKHGRTRGLAFTTSAAFLLGILPYVALTALLPFLGVMFNGYPVRTLLTATDATTALSFLVMGAAVADAEDRAWTRWLLGAMALQLAYGGAQMVYLARGPGWQLFVPLHHWDLSLASISTFVESRASGLYLNPNELGLWAGVAAILAWSILPSRTRPVGIVLAMATLLLSQSRGDTVALAAALVAGGALAVASGRISASGLRAATYFSVAAFLAVAVALAIGPPGELVTRFGSLVQVLIQGPTADPNLAGRLDYWAAVVHLNAVYPFGTWGSPELLLGTAVDSSWFQAFAQGSVLYVTSLALLLGTCLAVRPYRHSHALRMMAILVAVAGVTQTPFGYPIIVLFWMFLGAGLQSTVAVEHSHPSHMTSGNTAWVGIAGGTQ